MEDKIVFNSDIPEELFASEMNERKIFSVSCGEDEFGVSKSMVSIKMSDFDIENEKETVYDEIILDNPVVNIFKTPALTMVDLTFTKPKDFEFINTVARLQEYVKTDMMSQNENIFSTIVLTIMPKDFLGELFCSGAHGTFCIMPSKPDVPADTIRFIFQNSYFYAFKIPEEIEFTEDDYGTSDNENAVNFDDED